VTTTGLEISGAFSGSYMGDGAALTSVSHFGQIDFDQQRVALFSNTADSFGELDLKGVSGFNYLTSSNTLEVPGTGSFPRLNLLDIQSGSVPIERYLGITHAGEVVLTSSTGGGILTSGSGPINSVQIHTGAGMLSGSASLLFNASTNTMVLTGTLDVSGAINANELNINVTNKNVINLDVSGSTKFGDTPDDTHQLTGSVLISGSLAATHRVISVSSYTILYTDYLVGVNTQTISAICTLTLPLANTLPDGQMLVIKDEQGSANTWNIKVTSSGADTIDGQSSIMLESSYGALNLYTNGNDKYFIY